jgi:hypothetical protein
VALFALLKGAIPYSTKLVGPVYLDGDIPSFKLVTSLITMPSAGLALVQTKNTPKDNIFANLTRHPNSRYALFNTVRTEEMNTPVPGYVSVHAICHNNPPVSVVCGVCCNAACSRPRLHSTSITIITCRWPLTMPKDSFVKPTFRVRTEFDHNSPRPHN